jgi:hypothetical protein
MKLLSILFVALLTGCSTTVPVVAKFPEVPKHLMVKCPHLNKLNDDAKLSNKVFFWVEGIADRTRKVLTSFLPSMRRSPAA